MESAYCHGDPPKAGINDRVVIIFFLPGQT